MKTPTARKYGTSYRVTGAVKNELLEMTEHKRLIEAAQRKADDINKTCPEVKAIVNNDATITMITGDKYKIDTIQPEKKGYFDYANIAYILLLGGLVLAIGCAIIFGHS